MRTFVGIIPARYASTRFPGKPLVDVAGKSMIQRVYELAASVIEDVVVATDDERIFQAVEKFSGKVVMTSDQHRSGTDRCAEALEIYSRSKGKSFDVVINIQGDEPFVKPTQIEFLKKCFNDPQTQIATLIKPIIDNQVIFDPNRPKVVIDTMSFAMYFSRSAIPFIRDKNQSAWEVNHTFYQHIGMYAYQSSILHKLTALLPGNLEKAESLEQLRWLENGFKIKTAITEDETYGIDTPEDLERIIKLINKRELF
jgi:3-deoxy-manno-octulosonate cytidylyltransferase (CMP-KDO synthetase)